MPGALAPMITVSPATAFAGTDTEIFTIKGSGFETGAWESISGSIGPASWVFVNAAGFIQRAEIEPSTYAFDGPFEGRLLAKMLVERWRGKTMALCLSIPSLSPPVVCAEPKITFAKQ